MKFTKNIVTKPHTSISKKEVVVVHRELEMIRIRNSGVLTPKMVVQEVKRNRKSPLAKHFDTARDAAEKWWLEQARSLISSVYFCVEEKRELGPAREYVAVVRYSKDRRGPEHVFVNFEDAIGDDRYREQQINQCRAELLTWQTKYQQLKAYCAWYDALSKQIDSQLKRRKK